MIKNNKKNKLNTIFNVIFNINVVKLILFFFVL
jgi:hypothetical protein